MESPEVFGDFNHLVGVSSIPAQVVKSTAVIFVNSGLLHNIGPYRLYVRLARSFERDGIISLRFDLSGIGESHALGSVGTSLKRAADEIKQAMDLVESKYGIENFLLLGLCSGADDGFSAAISDARVKSLVLLDGFSYKTRKYSMHYYWQKVTNSQFWINKFKRFFSDKKNEKKFSASDIREFPPRDQAAIDLQYLIDRGVKIYALYTGANSNLYNYKHQFREMFSDVNFRENVTYQFFRHADHTLSTCEDRDMACKNITDWVVKNIDS